MRRCAKSPGAAACVDLDPLPGDAAGRVEEPRRSEEEPEAPANAAVSAFLDPGNASAARAGNARKGLFAVAPCDIALDADRPGRCDPHHVAGIAADPGGTAVEARGVWEARRGGAGARRERGPSPLRPPRARPED